MPLSLLLRKRRCSNDYSATRALRSLFSRTPRPRGSTIRMRNTHFLRYAAVFCEVDFLKEMRLVRCTASPEKAAKTMLVQCSGREFQPGGLVEQLA